MCSGGPSRTQDSWVALRDADLTAAARVGGGSAKIIVDRAGYTADSGSVDRTKKLTRSDFIFASIERHRRRCENKPIIHSIRRMAPPR
jgi:hypothetical protein